MPVAPEREAMPGVILRRVELQADVLPALADIEHIVAGQRRAAAGRVRESGEVDRLARADKTVDRRRRHRGAVDLQRAGAAEGKGAGQRAAVLDVERAAGDHRVAGDAAGLDDLRPAAIDRGVAGEASGLDGLHAAVKHQRAVITAARKDTFITRDTEVDGAASCTDI